MVRRRAVSAIGGGPEAALRLARRKATHQRMHMHRNKDTMAAFQDDGIPFGTAGDNSLLGVGVEVVVRPYLSRYCVLWQNIPT